MARKITRLLVFFFFLQKVITLHGSPKKTLKITFCGYKVNNFAIDVCRWLSPREYLFKPQVTVLKRKSGKNYDFVEYSYGPKSLLRKIQIEQAMLIAFEIYKLATEKNPQGELKYDKLEIKSRSLGSSIAIYLIAILAEITHSNSSIDQLISKTIIEMPFHAAAVKTLANHIIKKELKLNLITIGTPISKELDLICNCTEFLSFINNHYHFFYESDFIAKFDPGLASESVTFLLKKAVAFSSQSSLAKMKRKQFNLKINNLGFKKCIAKIDFLKRMDSHRIIIFIYGEQDKYLTELLKKTGGISGTEFFEVESLEPLIVKKRSKKYFEEKNCFLKKDIFEIKKTTLKKALYSLGILIGLDRYFGLTEKIKSKGSSVLKI